MIIAGVDPSSRSGKIGLAVVGGDEAGGKPVLILAARVNISDLCPTLAKYQPDKVFVETYRTKKGWPTRKPSNTLFVNMGMGIGAMDLIYSLLKESGFPVMKSFPCDTKLTDEQVYMATGFEVRGDNNVRDAVMIAFNGLKLMKQIKEQQNG